jgi:hypothetical protein
LPRQTSFLLFCLPRQTNSPRQPVCTKTQIDLSILVATKEPANPG